MKWVKLVVGILGALGGLVLIWLGVVFWLTSEIGAGLSPTSTGLFVVGGIVFLCALIFLWYIFYE